MAFSLGRFEAGGEVVDNALAALAFACRNAACCCRCGRLAVQCACAVQATSPRPGPRSSSPGTSRGWKISWGFLNSAVRQRLSDFRHALIRYLRVRELEIFQVG